MSTPRGLQAWGDNAAEMDSRNIGRGSNYSPRSPAPIHRCHTSTRRGPVHTGEIRATSADFREVRFLDHNLMKQSAGTSKDTPGPGTYDVRPSMKSGTTFAEPRPRRGEITNISTAMTRVECKEVERFCRRPSRPRSNRLQTPFRGADSPGPAYSLPSDFDLKRSNKQSFQPTPSKTNSRSHGVRKSRKRGRLAGFVAKAKGSALSSARMSIQQGYLDNEAGGAYGGDHALGVHVETSLGQGVLLEVRMNGMSSVLLPWGVLFTGEVLTRPRRDETVTVIP